MNQAGTNEINIITKRLDNACVIEFGTRVVNKKDGGSIYPVYGGGGATFKMDTYNRENCLVVSRFAMSKQCTRFVEGKFYLNDSGLTVKPKNEKELAQEYLDYLLLTLNDTIYSLSRGTAQRNLNVQKFRKLEIKYPDSIELQLHIANLLSKAENLIAQRKESILLLDEFLKSVFLEMFGDPVRNEKGWEKDKVISYTDCIVPGRDKPKSFTGNVPWFTTEDLIHKGYVTKSKKGLGLSKEEINEVRARVIPAESVLITCVGDLGIVSVCKEDCVVNQQLHAFICKDEINNLFLMYALSFQTNFMYKKATSTTVPYMNKTTCNSIPVIVPPIELQTQFAQIVEKTEALKTQYQQSLQELENLYGSLSQKAFRGELCLKDDSLLMAAEPNIEYKTL